MSQGAGREWIYQQQTKPLRAGDPRVLGRWRVLGRIGSGGMGIVYLAEDPRTGDTAAVKVMADALADQPDFRARFAREIEVLARVAGPFVAAVKDGDAWGDPPWLATEYVPGPDLAQLVTRYGPLGATEWNALATGLLAGLARLHASGVVHRDLKPANILLAADGPRIIDFGIAKLADATSLTETGVSMGTVSWLAPEQFRDEEASPASDAFAAGEVLAFAATGRPPFGDGSAAATMQSILHESPDLSGIPADARTVIEGLLVKDPASRWRARQGAGFLAGSGEPTTVDTRATQLWHDSGMTEILTERPAAPPTGRPDPASYPTQVAPRPSVPPVAPAPEPREPGSRAWLWALAAVAVVAMLAGVWMLWISNVVGVPGTGAPVTAASGSPDSGPSGTPSTSQSPVDGVYPDYPLVVSYPPTESGRTAAAFLSEYTQAISEQDWAIACDLNTVVSCDQLSAGSAGSSWSDISISSAETRASGEIEVWFSATTRQPSELGPDGDTCSNWELGYVLQDQGGAWVLTDSLPGSSNYSCD